MPPTHERAAQLERLAKLPARLQLGITLGGITKWAQEGQEPEQGDGLAICERLKQQGSPHVAEATVVVVFGSHTSVATLLDALANFLKQQGLRVEDTFFWVRNYVLRWRPAGDLPLLGECVSAVGHTVLLMDPWHEPDSLKCAYCIKEIYHTHQSGAQFDAVMSSAQEAAFEAALLDDFNTIQASLDKVDVRAATCLSPEVTKAVLDEVELGMGVLACNTLIVGLLRKAQADQARVALAGLPASERGTSRLLTNLAMLLQGMGKLEEANPLLEEALRAKRNTLGTRWATSTSSCCSRWSARACCCSAWASWRKRGRCSRRRCGRRGTR